MEDFKILALKYSNTSTASHELHIKKHSVRETTDDKPLNRTLFILNVPPYATEDSLKRVFSKVGAVSHVILQDKPNSQAKNVDNKDIFEKEKTNSFKVAYIVYTKSSGLTNALKLETLEPLFETKGITGMQKWIKEYNGKVYNGKKIKEEIDKFMITFDKLEEKKRKNEKLNATDDEGWTVVTKQGRKPGVSLTEKMQNKESTNKKKKKKELLNFYTFQIRETKMKQIASLRQKFEEDKKKIELLKQNRKFRPY